MTITVAPLITAFTSGSRIDRALSDEALALRLLIDAASAFSGSVTVGEPKRVAQEALRAAFLAAQVDDWDGEGAKRAEPSTCQYAADFLNLLPRDASVPEITVDNDGEILFEWDQGRRQVFSVSIGRDGTLTFAGLFGHAKIHGVEHFGETLPVAILDGLRRVLAHAGT